MHHCRNFGFTSCLNSLDYSNPVSRANHPLWFLPQSSDICRLRVFNSLTEAVEPFVPLCGRRVKWYTCGPTVYDVAHLGHARAYLTFDIIRRIMEDYFGYQVFYQMNITDIDDKIIKRARVNALLKKFRDETLRGVDFEKLVTFTKEALDSAYSTLAIFREQLLSPLPEPASSRLRQEREEKLLELQLKETQLTQVSERISSAICSGDFDALFSVASGVNGDLLDFRYGSSVFDQNIFLDHARYYEGKFFDDMRRLGVRDPDVVTRVTEYIPQIVDYIRQIMDNGFAYKGTTSIFFDTVAFKRAGYSYPKLKPVNENWESDTTEAEMAEGEGTLTTAVADEKRNSNDFALWKFSKPGEPQWPSPWGPGRPGWHIECSVMASDILGTNMDIHSGGCDLKFPHHDNECAQSEAHNQQRQWVNYFLHCGHLHISGLKMSKSLKNFITIQQALDDLGVTARTMRLLFLANHWYKPMNFSEQSINEAREQERVLRAFFGSVDVVLRNGSWTDEQGLNQQDRDLRDKWTYVEDAVDNALRNNFDTPAAMDEIMSLVSETNQYLLTAKRPSTTLVGKIGRYVTRVLQIFGLIEGTDVIGFTAQRGNDDRLIAVMDATLRFRDAVRDSAKQHRPRTRFYQYAMHYEMNG
ncbi:tRNA synthetases class I (C) catalytic domain [Trypanosoma vivax]|nr:tRNA synthetases class I (C) catalytic domain [Trypanosoma vivax]